MYGIVLILEEMNYDDLGFDCNCGCGVYVDGWFLG